jgi:hypothetical protein
VLVLVALGLAACSPPRALESARVLADVAVGSGPSALKANTPEPERRSIPGPAGQSVLGDLYWPGEDAAAALVLVPGAVARGKDDPRLVAFANTFARARFAVLVPEIPNLRTQHLGPEDVQPIGAAIRYLGGCVAPAKRAGSIGVAAISYAAGPALVAALAPANRDLVGYLTAIGGYYDVEAVVTFFTTGYFREGPAAPWRYREPNAYGKWVFVRANAVRLAGSDRVVLGEIAARKLDDLDADIADLRARLGPEGRAVMALLDNPDPDRVPALIERLPAPIRSDLDALDLERRDLSQLPFDLILVHGRDDPIIPSTESQALAAAAPAHHTSLYVIDRLTHINLSPGGVLDGLDLWRAIYRLLSRRDAAPAPEEARCRPPPETPAHVSRAATGTR